MKFLNFYVFFAFTCGITSHVFACSPSHLLTEFAYDRGAVALNETNRTLIASSLAQVTQPGVNLERVEMLVWRGTKPASITAQKLESEKSQARVEYLQEFFIRLGSPLKVHIGFYDAELPLDKLIAEKFKTVLKINEPAEISIVHWKPCQCRINIAMPANTECPRF
jgi:hypothetical protein